MPENIDEPKSLHELVSKIPNDDKNRRVVGYSVGSYVGVLSALEKAKMLLNPKGDGENNVLSGSGVSFTSRSWTLLSNLGLSSTALVNEFYQTDLNLVRVVLRDYMPFVLDYTGDDGKILRTCVNRKDYASSYPLLNQGMALSSTSNPKFPPGEWSQNNLVRCKNGLADEGLGFVIGLGVAFNQVVINYFKHFYPQMSWEMEKLKKLAAEGYLYGELMVPLTKVEVVKPTNTLENTNAVIEDKMSGNAKVLHSKITVDISQSNTSAYNVFVPVPLMLIDDFKELGYVKVEHGNKTDLNKYVENVGDGKLKFPFSDKKFDHKKCLIEGFTPDAVKDYVPGPNLVEVKYKHTGLNDGKEVLGRMRFYFSPDAEGVISSMVGSIPLEYKEKLFRGVIAEDSYYKIDNIITHEIGDFGLARAAIGVGSPAQGKITDSCFYYPNQVNWNSKYLATLKPLVIRYATAIEGIAKAYNINTRMFLAQICMETGWFKEGPWTLSNNPGGLTRSSGIIKKEDARNLGELFGNVIAWADHPRPKNEGAVYYCFHTPEDGLRAKACQIVNNTEGFVGINKRGDKTVKDYFYGIQSGSKPYDALLGLEYSYLLSSIYQDNLLRP